MNEDLVMVLNTEYAWKNTPEEYIKIHQKNMPPVDQ
jgi:hypothetical protein